MSCRVRSSITCALLGLALCDAQTALSADPQCGAFCLYVALKGLDIEIPDFEQFQKNFPPLSDAGYSMTELADVAKHFGAHTAGVETSIDKLKLRKPPFACIALIEEGHYVLLADEAADSVTVVDPPRTKQIPASTLGVAWKGQALLVSNSPLELEADLRSRWPMLQIALLAGVVLTALGFSLFFVKRFRSAGKP